MYVCQGLEEEMNDGSNPLNPGNFKHVKLIPDGAALFTRKMGMSCTWESERGFGERSWRYSAVINDGKIEKLFVEVLCLPASRLHRYVWRGRLVVCARRIPNYVSSHLPSLPSFVSKPLTPHSCSPNMNPPILTKTDPFVLLYPDPNRSFLPKLT
jgi:hypothetical protein